MRSQKTGVVVEVTGFPRQNHTGSAFCAQKVRSVTIRAVKDRARLLTRIAALGSAALVVTLGVAALVLESQLALAQAADSLLDVTGAFLLAWAVSVAREPRDAGHPMGHSRAEALGALGIAALASLLAFEVGRSALRALTEGVQVQLKGILLVLFFAKVVFKAGLWGAARRGKGPALRALCVDARNDVLVGTVAVLGFVGGRLGAPELDAWLTLPLAVYIGWSGVGLARENIDLLMGAAPSDERQQELLEMVTETEGVSGARELRAQHLGSMLSVVVQLEVPGGLSVAAGHQIAERVRQRLEAVEDVVHASVVLVPQGSGAESGAPRKSCRAPAF